jgi:hypothetical protein
VATVHYFCFRSFTQSFGATSTEFVTQNVAGFVEEAMRMSINFLSDAGLRYNYATPPKLPTITLDSVTMEST